MARPQSSSGRPTHISLPSNTFRPGSSPNGSPSNTPGLVSPASPRNSFLPSFMRTRSRAATLSGRGASSPVAEQSNPLGPGRSNSRDPSTPGNTIGSGVTRSVSTPASGGLNAQGSSQPSVPPAVPEGAAAGDTTAATTSMGPPTVLGTRTYRVRLVPHLETSRSLAFDPVVRELVPMEVPDNTLPSTAVTKAPPTTLRVNGQTPPLLLKVGRFTERGSAAAAAAAAAANQAAGGSRTGTANGIVGGPPLYVAGGGGDFTSSRVGFKSKVVSRNHAEMWCDLSGKFFIRDTASSSGTFLNHIRLSSPNTESRPTQINDGDILQLGVDYQGGYEDNYRCIKIRIELGRDWQRPQNTFNTNAMNQLHALGGGATPSSGADVGAQRKGKLSASDCCICLFSVRVCQSLFVAPCSHLFHYKCIRPLLAQHYPAFSCPLCRTFANLEEDIETEDASEIASRRSSGAVRRASVNSIRAATADATSPGPSSSAPTPADTGSDAPEATDDSALDASTPEGGARAIPQSSANASRRTSSDAQQSSIFDVQTPMNETFLSGLAPPGLSAIMQRMDIAEPGATDSADGLSATVVPTGDLSSANPSRPSAERPRTETEASAPDSLYT